MSTLVGTQLNGRYRLDAQIGDRRDVDGLPRLRHRARAPGRGQAHAPRDRGRLRPARALPPRGARRRPAQPPAHRRRHRRRRGRTAAPTSSSSTSRARRSRTASAASAASRSTRRSPTRSRSPARSAPPTTAASSTATSSPRTSSIDEEGSAKVTDFGIARTLDQEGLTADGRVLGTTDYVSPEQALGHDVTGQSDIYSLGIVLFEMLTGDVPFHGENQVAVAMKHVREELPDVQMRRPEVSAALAAVLDRMTDKDLERRYPDAHTLIADLEDVLAIETARSGHADRRGDRGPAHAARRARRRLPLPPAPPHPGDRRRRRAAAGRRRASPSLLLGRRPHPARHRRGHRSSRRRGTRRSSRSSARPPRTTTRSATTASTPTRPRSPSTATPARPGRPRPTAAAARRQGRRRPLRRRHARGRRHPDRASTRRRRAGRRDLRRRATARARRRARRRRRLAARRRRHRQAQAPALQRSTPPASAYRYYLVWITKLARGRGARRDRRDLAVPQDRTDASPRSERGGPRAPRG